MISLNSPLKNRESKDGLDGFLTLRYMRNLPKPSTYFHSHQSLRDTGAYTLQLSIPQEAFFLDAYWVRGSLSSFLAS